MTRRLAGLILVVALLAPAHAAEPGDSPALQACMTRAGGVTATMLDCIGAEHRVQDARLNAAYRAASRALPATRRASLTAAQRAWIAFRDSECGFVADPDGGSLAHVMGNDCMLRMTAERRV